ncbi:D-glucuronyl C5-epimerase family protein [Streptomyces sp. ID05-04B]|uniref:D-glucuronyl C5-epimerase family protein n=1 Tax=unclassified Streptomyces TaxID=2593676 RepID=UPI00131F2767|nr:MULTISPECIES: D-glucuronyl C5-epimerase family protein [unclassified Streptomyces]MDX5565729.1 D-glucuronyl C5-epimerase family protein [Streptomyces sp. ID05-04B]
MKHDRTWGQATLVGMAGKAVRDLRRPSFPVDVSTPPGDMTADQPGRYPLDLRPMTAGSTLDHERVVVTRAVTGATYRNPVSVSLYALAQHTGALAADGHPSTPDQPSRGVQALLTQAGWLRASQDGNGGWRYPVPVPRYGVRPGWYSAMAQGLAVSVMLRGYATTGQRSFLDASEGAVELMLRPLDAGGCSHYDQLGRPFPEECPSDPASHILNGAVFALFGLCELSRHRNGTVHERVADRLRDSLAAFDLGYWTRYDLRHAAPASFAYHCLHVALLTAAGRVLADPRWPTVALAWDRYTRSPASRLRAAAGKGRFVLEERRARS